ncbi:hypothetical protein ACVWXM_005153 [Bradyrhizobium sp. GM7.3]
MNKMSIISELHKITDQCLLGAGSWPAEEMLPAFWKTLKDLGLYEDVPGSRDAIHRARKRIESRFDHGLIGHSVFGNFLIFSNGAVISKSRKQKSLLGATNGVRT